MVAALVSPDCYDHAVDEVRVVETHISWVFLTGELAYKVKKPVKLPFVDFSTLERRLEFCNEELRLNRRLAAEIYLDVVPIGGEPSAPRIGRVPAFEYAVKMRQFPDDARLDRRLAAGALQPATLLEFAERLAEFHGSLPPVRTEIETPPTSARSVEANVAELREQLRGEAREQLEALGAWTSRECGRVAAALARRAAAGAHRECHGDLHLENLLLMNERVVAFDALEFDPKLREIDVMSETAFLAMDLSAHGRADLAYAFLTRYLETGGDYDGLEVLRFYLVHRALVRAKVRAIKAAQHAAEASRDAPAPYLGHAAELAAPRRPLLLLTHGLSGSGKTHVTEQLLGRLPGVRVRSDLERKRLLGVPAAARTGSGIDTGAYDRESTEKTYARLGAIADVGLAHEFDVIVDAAFLRRAERAAFRELAERRDARFAILDCVAPEAELRRRIAARGAAGGDASEATAAVLDHQLATREPLDAVERAVRVDTTAPLDSAALAAKLAAR